MNSLIESLVATRTMDAEGKTADVTNIPLGKYLVKEDVSSKGYLIDENEYYYLLASLIEGIPFVSNITGTYGAYLKDWDKRAFKKFEMIRLNVIDNAYINECYNINSNDLISKISGDILYLDPPYNERQYLPNYHLLETIAKYDNPKINGKTGIREYTNQKSNYCIKRKVYK